MKRVLLVIAAALAVFAGILLVLPSFIDWNKYRTEIVGQLENATGHHYDIGGGLSLAILPYPHVVVEKLSIAPAKGKEPLASMEKVDVSVALMPLFKGQVVVNSVVLVKPDIHLSVAADGTPSWMTPVLKEKMAKKDGGASGESVANAVALNDIRIKDGAFEYSDKRSKKVFTLKDIDVSVHGDTLFGPFSGNGTFEYNGQLIKFEAKTGKKSGGADSLALQASANIPSSSTAFSWSGVVAMGEKFEIQGETALDTANAGALMALGGGAAPAGFDKPLSLRGILTASPQKLSFQNMKLGYAGESGSGSFTAENLSGGGALVILADLKMDDAMDMADFLSPATPESKKKEKRFLPETVTLPRELGAKIVFAAPSVSYAGKTVTDLRANLIFSGKTLDYEVSAATPGRGEGRESGALTFGSLSKSAQTGVVTLSDPSLSYNFDFKAERVEEVLKAFMPSSPVKGKFAAKGKGKMTAKSISFDDTAVDIGGTQANVSGAYTLGARDKVKVSVASSQIDIDKFMPAADPAKKTTIEDMVKNIALPFDLDAAWALEQAKLKGRDYSRLAGQASLTGKKLQISSLEVKDGHGNTAAASGSIGDITVLKDIYMNVRAATPDAPALIAEVTGKPAALPQGVKSGEVVAAFKGQPDKLDFTANLKAMNGTLDVSGVLADMLKTPVFSGLTLRLKHPNYVDLARLFAPDFKSGVAIKKSLDVFASVKREGAIYSLTELQADIGPAQIAGAVTADMYGAKPSIKAKIQAGDLPLDELLGHDVRHKGAVQAQPIRAQGQDSGRWSRAPMNNEWMHKFNLNLEGTAKSFSYGPWALSNAGINVDLKDGTLTVTKIDGAMYGGQVALSGKAVSPAPASPIAADGKVSLQNVSMESFVQAFSGSKLVRAKGDISFESEVATAGASPAVLISGLNGKGSAKGSGLVFDGFDLAKMSRTLAQPPGSLKEGFTSILDASMKGGSTKFDTLSSAFVINGGVVNFDELLLVGPDATVSSPGRVNLPLWTIDMESTITLVEPKDAPPLKAVFKGPLDNPGQTFAKSAMDGYVRNMIGAQVQDAILNKLEKKGALEGDKGQLLQGLIGGLTGQPVKPVQQPAPAPAPQQPVVQPAQQTAPAPAPVQPQAQPVQPSPQPQEQKEITPEDVFNGVLQGVLGGQ